MSQEQEFLPAVIKGKIKGKRQIRGCIEISGCCM